MASGFGHAWLRKAVLAVPVLWQIAPGQLVADEVPAAVAAPAADQTEADSVPVGASDGAGRLTIPARKLRSEEAPLVVTSRVTDDAGVDDTGLSEAVPGPLPTLPAVRKLIEQLPMSEVEVARAMSTRQIDSMVDLPYSAVGRLVTRFRRISTGEEFETYGTAFVIGAKGLITAGHCLYYQGAEAVSAAFYPNFRGQPAPVRFTISEVAWHPQWAGDNSTLQWDFGACITKEAVGSVTGMLGYKAGQEMPAGIVRSIGYPARRGVNLPFDGKQMWESAGGAFARGVFRAVSSDLTQGASGGPWVVETPRGYRVVGHNSWVNSAENGIMHSPVYDEDFLMMVRWLDEQHAFR